MDVDKWYFFGIVLSVGGKRMAEMRREALHQQAGSLGTQAGAILPLLADRGNKAAPDRVIPANKQSIKIARRHSRAVTPRASREGLRSPALHCPRTFRAGRGGSADDITETILEGGGRRPGRSFRDRGEQGTRGPCSQNRT